MRSLHRYLALRMGVNYKRRDNGSVLTMVVESHRVPQRMIHHCLCTLVTTPSPYHPLWYLERVNTHHQLRLEYLEDQQGLASRQG